MMKTDDLENELRNLKNIHVTESELAAYCDHELDQISRARVVTHLTRCFICERQLQLLREENAALSNRQVSANDIEFVERLMEQRRLEHKPSALKSVDLIPMAPWSERLTDYLQQMVASWRIYFGQGVLRGKADQGEEVWRWQSADGHLQARAMMAENSDLTIYFSANEMQLEGARLHFRLGSLNQESALRRISETEVGAQVAVPWSHRQGNMADISIEIV